MGNSFETESVCGHPRERNLLNAHYKSFGVVGGSSSITGGSVLGGYDALKDYGNSVYSKAKEQLIRNIAKDVASSLKIKSSFADNAKISDVVAKFKKIVPDPKKNRTIKASSKLQQELCQRLATSINKRYGSQMIDTDASPDVLCRAVAEMMYSLFTGLHTEFLSISGDVSRILRNLQVLQEFVDSANKKLLSDIANSGDDALLSEAENLKLLYNRLTEEISRQHAILSNLINTVIGPTGNSLITVLEENDDFVGLTKDLEKITGQVQFGEKLSYLLHGTSDVSYAAQAVNKALKEIGMSVSEYKNTKSMKDLRSKIYNILVKKKPKSDALQKMLVAAQILYRNDLAHDDIAKHLSKKGGLVSGGVTKVIHEKHDRVDNLDFSMSFEYEDEKPKEEVKESSKVEKEIDDLFEEDKDKELVLGDEDENSGAKGGKITDLGSFADMADEITTKSEDKNPFKGRIHANRKSITKQINSKEKYRKQLFISFNDQVRQHYDSLKNSLTQVSRKIGKEIPLSPDLDSFIYQLQLFADSQPDKENIHLALSGYREDAESIFVKNNFMKNLEALDECLSDLVKVNSVFRDIKSNVQNLLRVVDNFNDVFLKSLTDHSVDPLNVKRTRGGKLYHAKLDIPMDSLTEDNWSQSALWKSKMEMEVGEPVLEVEVYEQISRVNKYINDLRIHYEKLSEAVVEVEKKGVTPEHVTMMMASRVAYADFHSQGVRTNNDGDANWFNKSIEDLAGLSENKGDAKGQFVTIHGDNDPDQYNANAADDKNHVEKLNDEYTSIYKKILAGRNISSAKLERTYNIVLKIMLEIYKIMQTKSRDKQNEIKGNDFKDKMNAIDALFTPNPGLDVDVLKGLNNKAELDAKDIWIEPEAVLVSDADLLVGGVYDGDIKEDVPVPSDDFKDAIWDLYKYVKNNIGGDGAYADNTKKADLTDLILGGYSHYGAGKHRYGGEVSAGAIKQAQHYQTMKKSINEMIYYYRINGIKKSIASAAKSYESNVENYENILGEEAGFIIDEIQNKYNKLMLTCSKGTAEQVDKSVAQQLYSGSFTAVNDFDEYTHEIVGDEDLMNGYKFLLEYIRSAKIELIEAAQSLDLYLSKFTVNMQVKAEVVKDLLQSLEQLELVSKWFTNKSGDNLAAVFEMFEGGVEGFNDTTHYYEKVKESIDNTHYVGKFYEPIEMNKDKAVKFVKAIEKSIKSVRALENVISVFSKVNLNISEDVRSFMSSGMMYKAFMKYCVASVISVGCGKLEFTRNIKSTNSSGIDDSNLTVEERSQWLKHITKKKIVHYNNSKISRVGVGLRFNTELVTLKNDEHLYLMDPLQVTHDKIAPHQDICDKIFEMCMKSLSSKIFVLLGTYNLFNKPVTLIKDSSDSASLVIHPLRQILGGSNRGGNSGGVEYAKIIPEAIELYVRLPLLVEWYREVFTFEEGEEETYSARDDMQQNPIISMIPDMDNIWGDLFKVILVDGEKVNNGAYPASYSLRIIESINKIYNAYKSSRKSCVDIILEMIQEVNQRYGFIMREEIGKYVNSKYRYENNPDQIEYVDDDRVDYDILDSERSVGRRPAPSDKFRSFQNLSSREKNTAFNEFYDTVIRFRSVVESKLKLDNIENINNPTVISLNNIIKELRKRVSEVNGEQNKYSVVRDQIHGVSNYAHIDYQKVLLYHETVINPLTTLYMVYEIVNKFNKFCVSFNLKDIAKINEFANHYKKNAEEFFNGDNNPYKKSPEAWYTDGAEHNALVQSRDTINILTYLLRQLMNIGLDMNGLTEVYLAGGGPNGKYPVVDFNNLEKVCTNTLLNIEQSLKNLRKHIPIDLVKKVEANDKGGDNRINIAFIREHLINRLFKNKYGGGLSDGSTGLQNLWTTLANSDEKVYRVFNLLTFWDPKMNEVARNGNGGNDVKALFHPKFYPINNPEEVMTFPIRYMKLFKSGKGFNNAEDTKEKDARNKILSNSKINKNESKTLNANIVRNIKNGANSGGVFYYVYPQTLYKYDLNHAADLVNQNRVGLVVRLNHLIYNYASLFIDSSSKKIYKPLLDSFVNGHNAKDILNFKNINDAVVKGNLDFEDKGTEQKLQPYGSANVSDTHQRFSGLFVTEPQENAILFASLANGLNGLMTASVERLTGSFKTNVEETFTEVSENQKELMRAYLPSFEKQLQLIIRKAEFLKLLLEETNIGNNDKLKREDADAIDYNNGQAGEVQNNKDIANYTQKNLLVDGNSKYKSSDGRKKYLINMHNDIIMTCQSLLKCIREVSKELADIPMYMETYKDSLVDYKDRHGYLPFTPLSNLSALFNFQEDSVLEDLINNSVIDIDDVDNKKYGTASLPLLPRVQNSVGSVPFKFTYGTRGILSSGQKNILDYAPGVKNILSIYNHKMGGAGKNYPSQLFSQSYADVLALSRWTLDILYHKKYLDNLNWEENKYIKDAYTNLSCQTGRYSKNKNNYASEQANLNSIIMYTGSSNYNHSVEKTIKCVLENDDSSSLSKMDREQLRVYNILDLNVSPINFHALQREIPFINLINYSYTFDHMVKNFIGRDYRNAPVYGDQPIYGDNENADVSKKKKNLYSMHGKRAFDAESFKNEIYPRDTLTRHIIYPLGFRRVTEYVNNVAKIMTGNTSLSLGRPKFLSDQLWNKVLFQSTFNNQWDNDNNKPNSLNNARRINILRDVINSEHEGPMKLNRLNRVVVYDDNNMVESGKDVKEFMFLGIRNDDIVKPPTEDNITGSLLYDLSYIKNDGKEERIGLDLKNLYKLGLEGYFRYNSKLVRWHEWFCQLQRINRLLMRKQLEWVQQPVVSNSDAIAEEITEYKDNNVFSIDDFN